MDSRTGPTQGSNRFGPTLANNSNVLQGNFLFQIDNRSESDTDPWNVPRSVNPLFVGREDIGKKLAEAFKYRTEDAPQVQNPFIISGLGGTGKSEVCIKFAVDHRDEYWAVFWVACATKGTAEESFKRIGKLCGLDEPNVATVKDFLSSTKKSWLLIVDNADDPEVNYSNYFPNGKKGNIIVTTRIADLAAKYTTVGNEVLNQLSADHARELLLSAARIPKASWPEKEQAAASIVHELGNHTLAVLHAGSFIERSCEIEDYLGLYRKQKNSLLFRSERSQEHSTYGTVHATFEVSMERLKTLSQNDSGTNATAARDAVEFLELLAFMHYEGAIEMILAGAMSYASELIQRKPTSGKTPYILTMGAHHATQLPLYYPDENRGPEGYLRWRQASKMLSSFSLITIGDSSSGTTTLAMHSVVHAWLKERQNVREQSEAWLKASTTLALSCQGSHGFLPIFEQSHRHVCACLAHDAWLYVEELQDYRLLPAVLYQLASVQHAMGEDLNMDKALDLMDHLLLKCKQDYQRSRGGTLHKRRKARLRLPWRRNKINEQEYAYEMARLELCYLRGIWLTQWGDSKEAVQLLEKALVGFDSFEKVINEEDSLRLSLQHHLAMAYEANGQLENAIKLLEHVVSLRHKNLGHEGLSLLAAQHTLATLYQANGQVVDAVELLEHVVALRTRKLGQDHPSVVASQHELATAYQASGQVTKALKLMEHVVAVRKKKLMEDHPQRLVSQYELAVIYHSDGRVNDALKLLENVVATQESAVPEFHTSRLLPLQALEKVYRDTGCLEQADRILGQINVLDQ